MIQGFVNVRREAILPLVVSNTNGKKEVVEPIIDRGFN
jgi:hypothetical protein